MADPVKPPLPLLMRFAKVRQARPLTTNVVPVLSPTNQDVDRGYWYGFVPPPERRLMSMPNDRPIVAFPTMQQIPESADPQIPAWINSNCPPWVCPPYWAKSFDRAFNACIPWYEVDSNLGCFTVPEGYFLVLKGISYEALNAVQDDVFQFSLLVNGQVQATWEDILVDAAQANPASRYGLAGHYRDMPIHMIADRSSSLCIRARLRGAINLAGVSPNWPGQPILSGDCQMKIVLNGWLANMRDNNDGGPRPTDLGDLDYQYLEEDQGGGR